MARFLSVLLASITFASLLSAQEIPEKLQGEWVVSRIVPTRTISCWGQKEANRLVGTVIDYKPDSFRWKDAVATHPSVTISILNGDQFEQDYSGGGAADSRVTFQELGIVAPQATIIKLGHRDANITGATTEIPGDWALIKNGSTIIVAVCNVYFEAHRKGVYSPSRR